MEEYLNWLNCYKGYSNLTCLLYCKFAKLLNKYNLDYKKMLSSFNPISNNTKRVILSAIKKYYSYLNDKRRFEIVLPKKSKIVCDFITIDEYQKLVEYIKSKKKLNKVKLAMIRLLFETGIRSSELLAIKKTDIKDGIIKIRGKNNKQRIVYLSDSLFNLLSSISFKKSDKLFNFGYKSLYKKIKLLGLNVLNKHLTPHMFRRGFATHCIYNDVGIYELSIMMGHDNINTTKMYIRSEDKIIVMKNLFQ